MRAVGALRMDDYLKRKSLHKKIVTLSKKVTVCPNCGFTNGTFEFRARFLSLTALKYFRRRQESSRRRS